MVYIDTKIKTPIYEQIYNSIKSDILSGEISAGSRLPAIRELAVQLCVSRNTVENAYRQLAVEGYVAGRRGSGYTVREIDEVLFNRPGAQITGESRPLSQSKQENPPVIYDFQYRSVDRRLFPLKKWQECMREICGDDYGRRMGDYGNRQGEAELREEIQKYLYTARGIKCGSDQIVITCGSQNSLSIICRLLSKEYHTVGFEEPGFNGSRSAFETSGCEIFPLSVSSWEDYTDGLERAHPKVIYITPSHQFPTGEIMPVNMRYKLLEWAAKQNSYIIEDDYGCELQYHFRPVPPVKSIDTGNKVIYMGTFSISLSPALRISYIVLPPALAEKYNSRESSFTYSFNALTDQLILARFMKKGYWERHLRKVRKSMLQRRDALIHRFEKYFGDKVTLKGTNAGLHITADFHLGITSEEIISSAEKSGIKIYPLKPFYINEENCPVSTVQVGFGTMEPGEIEKAVCLLKAAVENYMNR